MNEIIIKDLKDVPCDLYGPNDEYIGKITNVLQFTDIRVQIKERKLSGYYFLFEGEKICIDKNGSLDKYPHGLFDTEENLLCKLLDLDDYAKV